jgi:hypothetical protein
MLPGGCGERSAAPARLPEAGGGHGLGRQRREDRAHRLPQLLLDERVRDRAREGRQPVLQLAQHLQIYARITTSFPRSLALDGACTFSSNRGIEPAGSAPSQRVCRASHCRKTCLLSPSARSTPCPAKGRQTFIAAAPLSQLCICWHRASAACHLHTPTVTPRNSCGQTRALRQPARAARAFPGAAATQRRSLGRCLAIARTVLARKVFR